MSDTLGLILTLVGIAGGLGSLWLWLRPKFRRGGAALDAILGQEAVTDRGGQIITPAAPGLVHRVASVEKAVIEWAHLNGLYAETQGALHKLEHRVKALEDSRIERVVAQAESAHMWRAVADNAQDARDESAD